DGALAQAQEAVARELAESSDHTRALDERRYAAGAISEAELARADVAALEAQQAVETAAQATRAAHLTIAFLLGVREQAPIFTIASGVLGESLPQPAAEQDLEETLSRRPDLLAAAAQQERASAQLALARRQRIPDISLNAQYQQ